MTNRDVKLLLSAYRPRNMDARDPFFSEALEKAKRNPKLWKWFVLQRVIDDAIVARLRGIEPPARLKLNILARLTGDLRKNWAASSGTQGLTRIPAPSAPKSVTIVEER